MKIVMASPNYYPYVGGVEYVVKSVAERLAKQGHDVWVIAGDKNTTKPKTENINGVKVMRWPVGAYCIPKSQNKFESTIKKLTVNTDVVHAHSYHTLFIYYVWKAWFSNFRERVRFIVTGHYHGTGHAPLAKLLWVPWRMLIKKIVTTSDAVHAVSEVEADLVRRDFGVEPIVIENGVEEVLLDFEWHPSGYVFYSGRIERYKNIDRLANIVEKLNRNGLKLSLKISGEGNYKEKLKKKLQSMKVEWELLPFQPYQQYLELLSHATLVASFSSKEAFSLLINEANTIGVPAVAALPWGENFKNRSRVLIIDISKEDNNIASEIKEFLSYVQYVPKDKVRTWSETSGEYLAIYNGGKS